MARHGRRPTPPVSRTLFSEGHRFDFFQAVRLLEHMAPDRAATGEQDNPAREAVRFRSAVRFDFPPSDVLAVRAADRPGAPAEMEVRFLSLVGALGPLPATFAEQLLERSSRRDHAFRDFLDLFHHRLVSLFFRARRRHRPALQDRPPDDGLFARTLLALIGLGTPGLAGRLPLRDRALLPAAGLLAAQARPMVGLERLVEEHFGAATRVVPFVGRYVHLDPTDWTRLGAKGANRRLADNAVLGRRVWLQDAVYRLDLGPLSLPQYLDLLPIGGAFFPLCETARFYTREPLELELRLTLRAAQVPRLSLGQAGDSLLGWSARLVRGRDGCGAEPRLGGAGGARLGWTSWLRGEKPPPKDVSIVLRTEVYLARLARREAEEATA